MMRFPLRDFGSFDVVAVRLGPFSRRSSHKQQQQQQQQQRGFSRVQRWHTGAVFVVARCISCSASLSTVRDDDDDDEHRNSDESADIGLASKGALAVSNTKKCPRIERFPEELNEQFQDF